ncbi:MAG TPA: GNAT family N-acetyltransferase, partial [Acidimicrobiia bacterium]|nr:GNAT family N-acetyltransferase [Acidimicrobiia bacterium]
MGVTVGPVGEDRAAEFLAAMGQAFGFDSSDEHRERFSKIFEWDRARAAYDGGRIVGTLGAYSFEMTVPGGTLPCAGTTVVAVLPTHRRRGVLRQMLHDHFDDVRAHEEPLASLWASESSIYGRFGYGMAAVGIDVEVSRSHVDFHRLAPSPAPTRLVSKEEARELIPPFYDDHRTECPGFFARSGPWWEFRRFHDAESSRGGATAYRYAVAEENGSVTGFAQYRFKENWDDGHGQGTVVVHELLGSTP